MTYEELLTPFQQTDYGFALQLLPLVLSIGIAWALSRKNVDFTLAWFPIVFIISIIFPTFSTVWVALAGALAILNIMGSKTDLLSEVISKGRSGVSALGSILSKTGSTIKEKTEEFTQKDAKDAFDKIKLFDDALGKSK